MVAAAITFDQLQVEHRESLQAVVDVLSGHPDYARLWKPLLDKLPAGEQRDRAIFMLAARWPDDVRGTDEHRAGWDHVNFPYQDGHLETSYLVGGSAVGTFTRLVETIDSDASRAEKAVALCWVFHLVGDVQQPLHAAALVDERAFRGGTDEGGKLIYVQDPGGGGTSVHNYWDGLVFSLVHDELETLTTADVVATAGRADELRTRSNLRRNRLRELQQATTFAEWATEESAPLAVAYVYENSEFQYSLDAQRAQRVSGTYQLDATRLAERRVVLGGQRLADLLASWF